MTHILEYVLKIKPTGSSYICCPMVTDTDIDFIVYALPGYQQTFIDDGWTTSVGEIEYDTQGMFESWRKGTLNYIITTDKTFFNKFWYATKIAKLLNLQEKEQRIKLFQAVTYGKWEFPTEHPMTPANTETVDWFAMAQ